MAVLAALQSAAIRLVGQKPGSFFGSTETFQMEVCDLVNEVAHDIARYRDWQALVKMATITANGTTTDFALPTDYDRQLTVSDMQEATGWFRGYQRVTDINAFVYAQNRDFSVSPGVWILYGNTLRFEPAPTVNTTYPYVTKNWAVSSGGTAKTAFDSDTDTFLLPERLLTLGLVWRWRENKKLDATGDQEAFVKALEEYAVKDGGSRAIRSKAYRSWPGSFPAYPYELG